MSLIVFDCEVYRDYFLIMFRNIETGTTRHYELFDGHPLDRTAVLNIMRRHILVSFNGRRYDVPIAMLACNGEANEILKEASDAIIQRKLNYWDDQFKDEFPAAAYDKDEFDHIDLIEVAPGQASLKIYGGRLHCRRMQDLPIEPDQSISPDQRQQLIEYCGNDLQTTIDLYTALKPQIELRVAMGEQYGVDLRSKSDAQIAEQVIRGRVQRATGKYIERPEIKPGTEFKYRSPEFISFLTPPLQEAFAAACNATFYVSATGKVETLAEMPDVKVGAATYRMGIGGLHSMEKKAMHVAEGCSLTDWDVSSCYPAIILRLGLYPRQMGEEFLAVYRGILKQRLQAKAAGNKVAADSLKIVVNGSFGKLGSKWSTLYSPDLMIQVTITGQLCLLMLIEILESHGVTVISANTDGVLCKCQVGREDEMSRVVWVWEQIVGFEVESTPYAAVFSRDVNNYVALKPGAKPKLKGVFAPAGLAKNPTNEVCIDAVVAFLEHGIPVEKTVMECQDVCKFVSVRKVTGGALKNGEFLGKAVRWAYAKGETGTIVYKGSGYTVARTEGARPLMLLPDEVPEWVDRDWYIEEARGILADVGWKDAA